MKIGVSGGDSNSQNQEFLEASFLLFTILLGRDNLKAGTSNMNYLCCLSFSEYKSCGNCVLCIIAGLFCDFSSTFNKSSYISSGHVNSHEFIQIIKGGA